MYNATQDLILTVKKKTISIVPQFKSNFIWPDTRGIKVHYLHPVHGHGSDVRDSVFTNSTKKKKRKQQDLFLFIQNTFPSLISPVSSVGRV